ncbi:NADH:ubiquinone reductase (Na(+)-transporting) subunit C [Flammeovirga pacifica]|uniref:Na(+)-translocating NADH-quinone reductase subunit C n=1 Tax=Flammeovirga pacifica TaxID=915059 RepID=A0A1S1YYI4_FLAPC|nr:NADH:ubiquinone reductase (Na(+)-transporting) subunit C [Flammeovirga pacifica]OHX66050.1 NADH:ubiquinone reductase (Na(+)-transporting) subunit C [Flammeovirga pacifica]
MQQSNGYVIGFAVVMTIVLGGLLATIAGSLNATQKQQIALDTKKQIMLSVMPEMSESPKSEIAAIYDKRIKVINVDGQTIAPEKLEKLSIAKEWKKLKEIQKALKAKEEPKVGEVTLPIYEFLSEDGSKVEAYILPMYGYGLWNDIWGYFALNADKKTVKGVVFSHKGETPGLGARISDGPVQDRYIGKSIFDGGSLTPIHMVKGEGHAGLSNHEVDGLSGATLTANGLNDMVKMYLEEYEPFLKKGASAVSMAQ